MVLDPHNLSVCLKLSFLDLPKMANGNGKWQIWQCIAWAFFDAQITNGGLKASEFNHKLDHGDQNYLRHCLGCQKKPFTGANFFALYFRRERCAQEALGIFSPERLVLGVRALL